MSSATCKYDGQPFSAASLAFLGKLGRVLTESPAVCPQAQLNKQNRLSHARRPRRSDRRRSGRVFSSDLDEYIPNGAFIIALAMAGCALKRVNFDSLNAKSSAWPSHEATTRMAISHEIVGAREQLADPSTVQRNVLQAFAPAATGTDIAAWPEFWEWVCGRRAQDNPRGDFVRDTRAVREDRNGAEGWHEACLLRLAVASAFRPWNPDVVGADASVQALGTPIHCRTDQEMMPSRKPPPSPTRKSLGRSVRPRARHAPVGPAAPARGARSSGTCRQPLARVPAPRLGGSFLSGAASITMQACPQERRFGNRQPQRLAEPVRGRSTSTTSGLGRGGRSPHCGGATGARSTLRT